MPVKRRLRKLEKRVQALERRPVAVPPPEKPGKRRGAARRDDTPAQDDTPGQDDADRVVLGGSVRLPGDRTVDDRRAEGAAALLGRDWGELADALAALGSPVRLRLVQRVLGGTATVQELTAADDVGTTGQVYHHLRQLLAAGWLRNTGGGRYEVPEERVVPLLGAVLSARR